MTAGMFVQYTRATDSENMDIQSTLDMRQQVIDKKLLFERFLKLGFNLLKIATRFKFSTQMAIGRFIGHRIMQLDAEHSRIAAINIETCFPIQTPQQNRELLLEHFESLGMGIVEMAISWWMPDEQFKKLVHLKGLHQLKFALQKGNGVIFASAQFTTPDILSRCLGEIIETTAIYAPHRSEFIDDYTRTHRGKQLNKILMHEDITAITDTLKQNKAVLFNHDMAPEHKQYIFADFFGEQAATNTAISRFARMTGACVIPITVLRRPENDGYDLIFESPLPDFPGSDIQTDTQRLNNVIERWVDTEPAQYGWSYPRFRQRPEGEPRFY